MELLVELLQEISIKLDRLDNISEKLDDIASALSSISSVYGLDDLHSKLDDVSSEISDKICGPIGYNLGDLNDRLNEVVAAVNAIDVG